MSKKKNEIYALVDFSKLKPWDNDNNMNILNMQVNDYLLHDFLNVVAKHQLNKVRSQEILNTVLAVHLCLLHDYHSPEDRMTAFYNLNDYLINQTQNIKKYMETE